MTIGLGGVVCSFAPSMLSIWDEDKSILYDPRFNWIFQRRGIQATRYQNYWTELWTPSQICSGNMSARLSQIGQDAGDYVDPYEPWQWGEGGQNGQVFIRGQTLDQNNNVLAGTIVYSFVTSSDILAGQTISDTQGFYACPTPYPSVAHYIVAYYSATNLAGTSINTLIPTN